MIKNYSLNSLKCHAPLSPMSSNPYSNDSLRDIKLKNNFISSNANNNNNNKNNNNENDKNAQNNSRVTFSNKNINENSKIPYDSPKQSHNNSYSRNNSKQDLFNLVKDPYYHQLIHIDYYNEDDDNSSFYSYKNNTLSIGNKKVDTDSIHSKKESEYENKNDKSSSVCDEINKTIQTVYRENEKIYPKYYRKNENNNVNNNNDNMSTISKINIHNNNTIRDYTDDTVSYSSNTYYKKLYTSDYTNSHNHHNSQKTRYNYHNNNINNNNNNQNNKATEKKRSFENYKRYSNSRAHSVGSNRHYQNDFSSSSSKDIILQSQNEGQIQQFITSKLNQMLSDKNNN